MNHFFSKVRQNYGDMKLASKFTLVLMITVTVPVIMMACFFYGKLYDMVVSYTIRQEQDISAKTAPIVEDLVQQVIDAHDRITDQDFFQTLFHQPVNSPFRMFENTEEIQEFQEYTKSLISSGKISGLQIYMDFPTSVRLFQDELTRDYFSPMSKAKGTYWYGLFQGTSVSSLFCPSFYLGDREKNPMEIWPTLLRPLFIFRAMHIVPILRHIPHLITLQICSKIILLLMEVFPILSMTEMRSLLLPISHSQEFIFWIMTVLKTLSCPPITLLKERSWTPLFMPDFIISNSLDGLWSQFSLPVR